MPQVSICLPTYRSQKTLPHALESVRRQTLTDWELLIVEDGSSDDTQALVEAFAREGDQPVHFRRHKNNRGVGMARNTALGLGSAPLVALLDADDRWEPEHLARAVAKIEETGAGVVHSGYTLFDAMEGTPEKAGEPVFPPAAFGEQFPVSLFTEMYRIPVSCAVFRRRLWEQLGGFDPALRHNTEFDLWLRCARGGVAFVGTCECTCRRYRNPAGLSAHAVGMAMGRARALNKQLRWSAIPVEIRYRLASQAWSQAARLAARKHPATAAEFLQHACQIEPSFWLRLRIQFLKFRSWVSDKQT